MASGASFGRLGRTCAVAALLAAVAFPARAEDVTAVYVAFWAGLPAAELRLTLRDGDASYHNRIEISTEEIGRAHV